jgi:hypothetical protein
MGTSYHVLANETPMPSVQSLPVNRFPLRIRSTSTLIRGVTEQDPPDGLDVYAVMEFEPLTHAEAERMMKNAKGVSVFEGVALTSILVFLRIPSWVATALGTAFGLASSQNGYIAQHGDQITQTTTGRFSRFRDSGLEIERTTWVVKRSNGSVLNIRVQ